tara:strand:+ start:82 stop:249 length:168 start_codon:yes stop_codon:yes gene_type:complete
MSNIEKITENLFSKHHDYLEEDREGMSVFLVEIDVVLCMNITYLLPQEYLLMSPT